MSTGPKSGGGGNPNAHSEAGQERTLKVQKDIEGPNNQTACGGGVGETGVSQSGCGGDFYCTPLAKRHRGRRVAIVEALDKVRPS